MATVSVRDVTSRCLGRRPRSVLKDVFGVYGRNILGTRARSLRDQLDRIQTKPFVRIACVTVRPPGSTAGQIATLQRDLDAANDTFEQRCAFEGLPPLGESLISPGFWVYCAGARVVRTGILGTNGTLDQRDCNAGWMLDFLGVGDHEVSKEEDDLFSLGRDLGASIVCYYLPRDPAIPASGGATSGLRGCAAHPGGRRGFWVGPNATQWTFAHELGHIVGNLGHSKSNSNLMFGGRGGTASITSNPPRLSKRQCAGTFPPDPLSPGGMINDRAVEGC